MNGNAPLLPFDRNLHQALPNPLAHAYRKAFNSPTPKELHDNACLFGLCLLRFLAAVGLALLREFQIVLTREEAELLSKTDRPAEGDWHRWLGRTIQRIRERQQPAGSLGARLDAYLSGKRETKHSDLPAAFSQLLSHLEKKGIVRKEANAFDFLLALIRYRNDTLGHGAVLPEEINQSNGTAILRAVAELAGSLPTADGWELKYVARSSLGSTSVECQLIHLMGPDWLREAPLSYPRGYPAPLPAHVILQPRQSGDRHLDLHPLLAFHNDRVLFFNGLRGKAPGYLEYDSAQKVSLDGLTQDYEDWKKYLGVLAPEGADESREEPAAPLADSAGPQRFRFDRLLGRGGMGEVWSAYDETLKRQVAIKRIRRDWLGQADLDRRFLQEARAAARLNHPNIVPILSIDSDGQGPYLVLEYVEGGSLRPLLQRGHLQLPAALAYLRQLLQALQHAHEHGLIHRDVKPENILLSRAGLPKLADFGLAWCFRDGGEAEERAGSAAEGTRAYLAPELRDGHEEPSPQSDLYSLGLTFYEMVTGRSPQRLDEKKVPSPALPLLRKLTHADPNLRYDTARSALDDCVELERALELAGRTREETLARIRQTAEQAFQHLAAGRSIDAQAGFERILAEDPDNPRGLVGLLLLALLHGDMEQAADRYRKLTAVDSDDPVFVQLRRFIEAIPSPTVLRLTPQPLVYSYRLDDLRRGEFVKELIEFSAATINLGDVGEILVELAQKHPGRRTAYAAPAADQHRLSFELERLHLEADFRYHVKPKAFFLPARLLAADVTLRLVAEPFETYRFVRYLTSNLARRFGRRSDWVRADAARHFGYDAGEAAAQWERLSGNFLQKILLLS